ncbi:MAG: glycosyltransferase family 4 protein [Deltaproteobacteria bacterium]
MKILLLNANRVGIGTYHRALHFGRELARRGHSVTMMTVSATSRFRAEVRRDRDRFTIVECPNFLDELLPWHASGVLDIALRIRELWRGNYDVVYAFEYQPNISIPVLLVRRFKRFVLISDWCDWHAGASYHFGGYRLAHAIDRRFEEHIRHRADFITTINTTLHDRARSIGIAENKLAIIGEGVDPSYIAPGDLGTARRELGLPEGVALAGTIRDAPNMTQLLCEALVLAPAVHLLVIGGAAEVVRSQAQRAGVADRLHAPGWVSDADLPRYLAACDALVLPLEDNLTNRGRWPHKLGDMIAAQRPVIASRGGEFPALLEQQAAALIVDHTPAAFARAITEVITDPARFAAMARRGRELVEQRLNWDVIGTELERAVERATGALR